MRRLALFFVSIVLACGALANVAAQSLDTGSIRQAVERLKPGEYLWMPQAAPAGPMLLIVNVRTQRAVLYRNGLPIAITTVSTGRKSHKTPLGVFTILEKDEVHFSSIYDNAPMPYMQRLTWGGVALHGGHLPGYPASHGCIRLPHEFAKLLYGETRLGMTVILTDRQSAPALATGIDLLPGADTQDAIVWQPDQSPFGPVSILISEADRRIAVLRNGKLIGSAPATIDRSIGRPQLLMLVDSAASPRTWVEVALPGQAAAAIWPTISTPPSFRSKVEKILTNGTTVILTPDPLQLRAPDEAMVESHDRHLAGSDPDQMSK